MRQRRCDPPLTRPITDRLSESAAIDTDAGRRADLFAGSGELRAQLRLHDWWQCAIGDPAHWPQALRSAYALILDAQFPMFISWGSEHTFLYNAAYITLLDAKHPGALGRPLPSVWPELWSNVAPLIARCFAGESTYGEDVVRTLWREGRLQENSFTLSYSPLRDEEGVVRGAFCVISDTTARLRLEQALVQADRRKDQFLAMLAHELRNPLAPISAAAELLKLPQLDPQRVRATGTIIARQVGHMTAMVDDLLDVSRVTGGLAVIERLDVDMKRVLADAVEQVRPLIEARQHHCVVEIAPGAAHVKGDYQRLVQVVANLCNNAAKYTPKGGRIAVQLALDADGDAAAGQVCLRVADDGIGIAPELLPHVFELFSQAERSADRAQGGLGLGLALVKSLVDLHGGSVTAESAGLGAGSAFTLRLPRVDAPAPAPEENPAQDSMATARRPLRLLVVDDNVDGAQMLEMFLQASGHEVMIAHTAQDALERAASGFDAYLLDIGLPGMDGNELARRLRAMPGARSAMLIAITGYGQQADGVTALAAGFDHYMVKPVDPSAIVALLSGLPAR